MHRLDDWRLFLPLAVALIVAGAVRSSWATRRDGFTVDEPWHVTAGVAYLRTGEYYLNPEHPPLVKLVAALAAPRSVFRFTEPPSLHDKTEERKFVQNTMYEQNDADKLQSRVRVVMYVFNGLLVLLFAASAFRVFGGVVALGALLFVLIDPTVAAHWPVVMALGRAAVGRNMERKNPAGIEIAARGTAIRAIHTNQAGSVAASANTWHNSERMTITPACACPARKKTVAADYPYIRSSYP